MRRISRNQAVVLSAGVLLSGVLIWVFFSGEKPRRDKKEIVPVTAATVMQKPCPVEIAMMGTVEANLTVSVKPQVAGILVETHFQEGQEVKKGDLLFSIDPRPFKAALEKVEADLAKNQIQLKNAEKEAERTRSLLSSETASQEAFDQARTVADVLASAVRADAAAIENAKLDLEYCSIRAPIQGRIGSCLVDLGNVVKLGEASLVVINQVKPIQVGFSAPHQYLAEIRRRMAENKLPVTAAIPPLTGKPYFETGELVFMDNSVDPATGTIRFKASFENREERLWPGQFVTVKLTLYVQADAIVIPNKAVQVSQKGSYVFVIKADETVEVRSIQTDRTLESETVVTEGLKAGERIVTDGQLRLEPGSKVVVKPDTSAPEPAKSQAEKSDPDSGAQKSGGTSNP